MTKHVITILAIAAVLLFAVGPAFAIDYDSTVADWQTAGLLNTDVNAGTTACTLESWGVAVEGGNLLAIMKTDKTLSTADHLFAGVSVNADRATTELDNLTAYGTDVWSYTDIHLEWGPSDEGWNLWGKNHDYTDETAVVDGAAKYITTDLTDDTVVMRLAMSELESQTAAFNAVAGGGNGATLHDVFDAGVRLCVAYNGWTDLGTAHLGGHQETVPEPSTLLMLAGGLLVLLAYAWRKRK